MSAVLNLAIFVLSDALGITNKVSVIAKTEPKRITPVPCADMVKSKLVSAESRACILSVLPTF